MEDYHSINRCISSIQRLSYPYFDRKLSYYNIGCGQQFFLLHISKNPGITPQELAAQGNYDKATATRAVQKLEKEGYVTLEVDQADKRVRHIYLTEKARPIIAETWKILDSWIGIITKDFTVEEKQQTENFLRRMERNANRFMEGYRGGE